MSWTSAIILKQKTTMSKKNCELYTWEYNEVLGTVTKTEIATGNNWVWVPKPRPSKAVCAPNNHISVAQLAEAGNKVRVRHFRWAYYLPHGEYMIKKDGETYHRLIVVPSSYRRDPAYALYPKGGYTHITAKTKTGDYVCASSDCSIEDAFCYRKGVEKALERLSSYDLAILGIMR